MWKKIKKLLYLKINIKILHYGVKEVNDFHTIDKNMIFALHHSAIQELSRENDKKNRKIIELENENTLLKERIKKIEEN